jgi:uncharacterized repeat protein (TIGR01451 family)
MRFPAAHAPLAVLAFFLSTSAVNAGQVACTPQAPYTNCQRVTYSGATQTFTVPSGVPSVRVTMWGAGGGGATTTSAGNTFSTGGASGGFADATVAVTPGASLTVTVGQGGVANSTAGTYGRGGGGGVGANSTSGVSSTGSSGGGMSALWNGTEFVAGNALMIAGGGGGSAFWTDQPNTNNLLPAVGGSGTSLAGPGGGTSGGNGSSAQCTLPYASPFNYNLCGQGGTQVAGGAAGNPANSCTNSAAAVGSALQGGAGCNPNPAAGAPVAAQFEGGGGGGGGWFGGGGGTGQNANTPIAGAPGYDGPGGGGSGFLKAGVVTSGGALGAGLVQGNFSAYGTAQVAAAPQNTNTLYTSSPNSATLGKGGSSTGAVGATAGNGEVVIQWVGATVAFNKAKVSGDATATTASFSAATNLASTPASITSATSDNTAGTTGTAIAVTTLGTAVSATETPAAGFALTQVSCTDTNSAASGNPATIPATFSGSVVTIPAANLVANATIVCTLTNTRALVSVSKTATGSGGTFTFTSTNLAATPASITIPAGGGSAASSSGAVKVTTVGTAVTITEAAVTGFTTTWSCSDANNAVTGNATVSGSGRIVTIPAAGVTAGSSYVCTFTNTYTNDLSITKDDGVTAYAPGVATPAAYTIVVGNSGPGAGNNAIFTDPAVTGLTVSGVTCGSAAGGAACPTAANTTVALMQGAGIVIPTLPSGGSVTFTVTYTVAAGTTGNLTNTATIAEPTGSGIVDSNTANNSASDTDTLQPSFGTCDSRLWIAQNAPTQLTNVATATNPFTFTAVGTATATYNALGYNPTDNYMYAISGTATNHVLRIGADGSVTDLGAPAGLPAGNYIAGSFTAAGNTLYVLPVPGGGATQMYAINVTTMTATLVTLTGAVPVSIADIAYVGGLFYSVTQAGQLISINPSTGQVINIGALNGVTNGTFMGAMFGAPNGLYGGLNTGGFYSINLTTGAVTLISGLPGSSNNDGANCPAANITFGANLQITKTDSKTLYTPGSTTTYTIVATNPGPFGAASNTVSDPLPAGVATASWTCAGSGGGTCGAASGSGAINDTNVNLPVGASVTYTLTLTIPANFSGALTNNASISPGAGTTNSGSTCTAASAPANTTVSFSGGVCTATDTDASQPLVAVAKTLTGGAAAANTFNFSLTGVTNTSDSTAGVSNGATVTSATLHVGTAGTAASITETSAVSPALSGYQTSISCVDANAATDGVGAGSPIALASGTAVTIPTTGMVANAAWTCTYTNTAMANVSIAKTDSTATYSPGGTGTYVVTVTNAATATATLTGATVSDLLPKGLTIAAPGISCTPTGSGTSCSGSGSAIGTAGTGALNVLAGLSLTLPPGGVVTITIPVTFAGNASSY